MSGKNRPMTSQFNILVADASLAVQNSVQEMLAQSKDCTYNIDTAVDGSMAYLKIFKDKPDLVLLDTNIPLMNGVEVLKKIKSHNSLKDIPIIMMASIRRFEEAFNAGANDFLVKPFNHHELLMRVQLNLKLAEKGNKISVQNETLKIQKQEAINQRDTILKQKGELMEDLRYARFVQQAILPSQEMLNDFFDSHFIYTRAKNIVSGDFFWITKKDKKVIIAVGDCTGHGMSGALMTMAGTVFLNEIIANKTPVSVEEILIELRIKVIHLLNQKGDIGEASNGMDIAICMYDESNGIIEFAGANNPIYVIRKDKNLEIIKGDRMPIGFYINNELPFKKTELTINKGDYIYLFTDGYPDQFGGPLGKKFRYQRFQELITQLSSIPSFNDQLEMLTKTMDDWIEGYEQIDDMLIVGIRL
jgi:phosphoserine phosphatase RsbU/P